MTSPDSGEAVNTRTALIDAIHALARKGVTAAALAEQNELMVLVREALPTSELTNIQQADILLSVFDAVVTSARQRTPKTEGLPNWSKPPILTPGELEATQLAAVGELLGLTDDAALEDKRTLGFGLHRDRAEQTSSWYDRKLRAAIWFKISTKTVERNAIKHWWPTFLMAVEHHLMNKGEISAISNRIDEPKPAIPSLQPGYVRRKREEAEFNRLVDDGAKLIAFIGQAGMGKTWLAKAATGNTVIVRVFDGRLHAVDLTAALVTIGYDSYEIDEMDTDEKLVTLICGGKAPRFVLLDNLESADELTRLLPPSTKSIVVATCRIRGNSPPPSCRIVQVSEMNTTEAARMIHVRLSHLNENDATYLASELSGYPLVISYACVILANRPLSVRRFCSDLKSDTAGSGRQIYTEQGEILYSVLLRVLSLVSEKDSLAYELLVLFSLMSPSLSTWSRFAFFPMAYARRVHNDVSELACAQAIKVLSDFSLLNNREDPGVSVVDNRYDDLGNDNPGYDGPVVYEQHGMHPFIKEMLARKFWPRLPDVYRHAWEAYYSYALQYVASGSQTLADQSLTSAAAYSVSLLSEYVRAAEIDSDIAGSDPELLKAAREFAHKFRHLGSFAINSRILFVLTLTGDILMPTSIIPGYDPSGIPEMVYQHDWLPSVG